MTNIKVHLIVISTFFLLYNSCSEFATKALDSNLAKAENIMKSYPDSAVMLLEKMDPLKNFNNYNTAYYYLLLTEARMKNKESLLPSDTLVDWVITHLNSKKDMRLKAKAWLYKGKIMMDLKEPDEALKCYQNAWDLLDKNDSMRFDVNIDVGNIYTEKGLYEDALNIYYSSYLLGVQKSDIKNISLSLRNIGYTYFYRQESDSAYYYLQQALVCAKDCADSTYLSDLIHTDLSLFYEEKGEYEKAISELQKVKEITPSIYLNKGSSFMNLQQYDSARYYLLLSSESDFIYTQAASYFSLSDLETSVGNYKKSIAYLKKYDELRDSIDTESKTLEIQNLSYKYNLKTIVSSLKTQQKIRMGIIILFTTVSLLAISSIFIIEDKRKKIKQQQQEKEILDLQAQILMAQNTILKIQSKDVKKKTFNYEELTTLQNQIDDLQCKMFRMKPIYSIIQQLNKQEKTSKEERKILKFNDRQTMKEEIGICFAEFINRLKTACPSIKEEDIELCCLTKLGLPFTTICLCFGFQDTDPIRQRKYQLKKRMSEEYNQIELFLSIFKPQKHSINTLKQKTNG
jgi:tetratricopeptide (TPR) repeat protein